MLHVSFKYIHIPQNELYPTIFGVYRERSTFQKRPRKLDPRPAKSHHCRMNRFGRLDIS